MNNEEYLTIDGTIEDSGHAVWFKIDAKSVTKAMSVDAPASGGFIVFGGESADVFQISMKK
ncbi:hypothetical protein D3C76_19380 [compost metagenome]